jgi:hypothetical protein
VVRTLTVSWKGLDMELLLIRTCNTERMNVARIAARLLLGLGALLWVIMFAALGTVQRYANLTYTLNDVLEAGLNAAMPAALAIGVFALAIFYERIAAVVLFVAAAGVVVWGVIAGWEAGLWVSMLLVMVLPVVVSGVLLMVAAGFQRACELEAEQAAAA